MPYAWKNVIDLVASPANSTINLVICTVPASHTYMIKGLNAALIAGGSAAAKVQFQISDASGANFVDVTPLYASAATTGNQAFLNLAAPGASGSFNGTAVASGGSLTVGILSDRVLAAGQILRAVCSGGGSGGGNNATVRVSATLIDRS